MTTATHHAINVVVLRTGLSAHVIRIWEKRYQAVEPDRTATNRRLYSEEQIERLSLLREITQAGHSISYVAKLPTPKLRLLAAESLTGKNPAPPRTSALPATTEPSFRENCLDAVKALDARALGQVLKRAETTLGTQGLLIRVVAPLAQSIGDLWRDGTITAAHEHFASGVLRTYLAQTMIPFAASAHQPVLVVTTPSGQLHELGALLVAALAANLGWQVTYLGASLPAPEIAGAARQNRASAVALSVVFPEDDPRIAGELTRLRELLPPETQIIVGGRALPAYRETLEQIDALQAKDLAHLGSLLEGLRAPISRAKKS